MTNEKFIQLSKRNIADWVNKEHQNDLKDDPICMQDVEMLWFTNDYTNKQAVFQTAYNLIDYYFVASYRYDYEWDDESFGIKVVKHYDDIGII